MDLGLTGKTAIVTGGASNIGRAIALALYSEGANVVIADLDMAQAERVATEARASREGGTIVAIRTDVTAYAEAEALASATLERFGRIDLLVNSVGWVHDRLFLEKPYDEWEKEIRVNLWSVIHCTRAVLPSMVERRSGRVISISSDAGRIGEYREAVYSACKAGIIALMKSLAREVGRHDITLNTVCPGLTVPTEEEMSESSMWQSMAAVFTPEARQKAAASYPLRRLGTARDIAGAVLFLASDEASFITGQVLSVSGGYSMAG